MYSTIKSLLLASIALVTLSNCTKQGDRDEPTEPIDPIDTVVTPPAPVIEYGKATFKKNGAVWNAPFEAWYFWSDTVFSLTTQNQSGYTTEFFQLSDIPCKLGAFPIENPFGVNSTRNLIPNPFYLFIIDGDQPAGTYFVDTLRRDHYLEILKYDTLARTVEGRFQMFLRLRPGNTNLSALPDTLSITDGRFYLPVRKP